MMLTAFLFVLGLFAWQLNRYYALRDQLQDLNAQVAYLISENRHLTGFEPDVTVTEPSKLGRWTSVNESPRLRR